PVDVRDPGVLHRHPHRGAVHHQPEPLLGRVPRRPLPADADRPPQVAGEVGLADRAGRLVHQPQAARPDPRPPPPPPPPAPPPPAAPRPAPGWSSGRRGRRWRCRRPPTPPRRPPRPPAGRPPGAGRWWPPPDQATAARA